MKRECLGQACAKWMTGDGHSRDRSRIEEWAKVSRQSVVAASPASDGDDGDCGAVWVSLKILMAIASGVVAEKDPRLLIGQ